ncbi:MAG: DUF6282 family protein [Bryobacterales bacterium]
MILLLLLMMSAGVSWAQLEGVVDVHAHVDPETIPRSVDAMDLARIARKEHMRAVVLKNHFIPTAPIAFLVAREVPGVQIFGGLALNSPVGGINPAAVEQMTQLPGRYGRIVWMPTMDAERVPVERDGKLLPEVYEVFKIMARENLALATGHATPENTLLLIREARKAGIDRIIVTHPINRMSLEQQQEAAKMGAYLEYCYGTTLEYAGKGRRTLAEYAKLMKALGAEHCIMSSDLGNAVNPVHPAGIKTYIAGLLAAGISESEIDIMLRRNPARLLDLE